MNMIPHPSHHCYYYYSLHITLILLLHHSDNISLTYLDQITTYIIVTPTYQPSFTRVSTQNPNFCPFRMLDNVPYQLKALVFIVILIPLFGFFAWVRLLVKELKEDGREKGKKLQ